MNNRKRQFIVGGAILLVIGLLLWLAFRPKYEVATYGFNRIHGNIQAPWQHENSLYFFTGSSFAKYDLASGSISRLSDMLLINQDIDKLTWSDKNVLFRSTTSTKAYDDLSQAVATLGAPKQSNYWWRYDFADKTYQLLQVPGVGTCQDLVGTGSSSFACLPLDSNSQGSKSITLLTPGTNPETIFSSDAKIHDIKITKDTLYFVATSFDNKDTLRSIDVKTKQVTELFKSKGVIISYEVSEDGTALVSSKDLGSNQDEAGDAHDNREVEYNNTLIVAGKTVGKKTVVANRVNTVRIGNKLFLVDSGGAVYQVVDNKLKQIIDRDPSNSQDVRFFTQDDKDTYYFVSSTGVLLTTRDVSEDSARKLAQFDPDADNDPSANFFINTPDENGTTLVQFYSNAQPFAQQALSVEKILRDDNFEPTIFKFNWSLNSTSGQIPVQPKAILLK